MDGERQELITYRLEQAQDALQRVKVGIETAGRFVNEIRQRINEL